MCRALHVAGPGVLITADTQGVQVEGREHLPAPEEPAVYVANHQSFLVGPSFQ